MDEKKGFYDFTNPEEIKRYVDETNDLRDELNELKTDFNNSQTAVINALKKVESVYNEGGLSIYDYDLIIEALRYAEI